MKQPIRSLNEIWFNMFGNEKWHNLQEDENLWSIYEGVARINQQQRYEWQVVKAQKEHECIREHKIKAGDFYCKHDVGGWGSDWKFCLGCTAMLFYFLKVEEMPPYGSTHWNYEEKKPVRLENNSRPLPPF